ncbi:hypothetical protein BB559_005690 [Furculomyces boomerangus]|uniref:Uncharacterized protein n=1 Tax=Furculomyces boomerangus TaxID=61424 RepID=A0A2T9Y7D0_9FUNG|nr:hypothetical protein BB559_005690 [Furculomyces boomerangus]
MNISPQNPNSKRKADSDRNFFRVKKTKNEQPDNENEYTNNLPLDPVEKDKYVDDSIVAISKGTKLMEMNTHSLEYVINYPSQVSAIQGSTVIDEDSGFMAISTTDHCYENGKRKSRSDIGVIICSQLGFVRYWERVRYGTLGSKNLNEAKLDLSDGEEVINMMCINESFEYIAVTNYGSIYQILLVSQDSEKTLKISVKTSVSGSGIVERAAGMFSKISKALSNLSSSSTNPNSTENRKLFSIAKVCSQNNINKTTDNNTQPQNIPNSEMNNNRHFYTDKNTSRNVDLVLVNNDTLEKWELQEKKNLRVPSLKSSINFRNLVESEKSFKSQNASFERIIDIFQVFQGITLVLFKSIINNEVIKFGFSAVSMNSDPTLIDNQFLNYNFENEEKSHHPRIFVTENNHLAYVVFSSTLIVIPIKHYFQNAVNISSNQGDSTKSAIDQNSNKNPTNNTTFKICFNSYFKISGISCTRYSNDQCTAMIGLNNGGGLLKMTVDEKKVYSERERQNRSGFVRSLLEQVIRFGNLKLFKSTSNLSLVDYSISNHLDIRNFSAAHLENVVALVSNSIVENKYPFLTNSTDLVSELDNRISANHRLCLYLRTQKLIEKISINCRNLILVNSEKLLGAADLLEYINHNTYNKFNEMTGVSGETALEIITQLITNVIKKKGVLAAENDDEVGIFFSNFVQDIGKLLNELDIWLVDSYQGNPSLKNNMAILYEANCIFLSLLSSPLAYRLEFSSRLYLVSQKKMSCNWWVGDITNEEFLGLTFLLFELTYKCLASTSAKVLPSVYKSIKSCSEPNSGIKLPDLPLLLSKPKTSFNSVLQEYAAMLEMGLFIDHSFELETNMDNFGNDKTDSSHSVDTTKNLLSNFIAHLGLFVQLCIMSGSQKEPQIIEMLSKLISVGKIGSALKLSLRLGYYDLIIDLLIVPDDNCVSFNIDVDELINACIYKYGDDFIVALFRKYIEHENFYTLFNFSFAQEKVNTKRANVFNSIMNSITINQGVVNNSNFSNEEQSIIRKLKWIHDLSIGDLNSAKLSLLEATGSRFRDINMHNNLLSMAKLMNLSDNKAARVRLVAGDKQNKKFSTTMVDSLMNMNKLIIRIGSVFEQLFPPKAESQALFDFEAACLGTTKNNTRKRYKAAYTSYKNSMYQLSRPCRLDVVELVEILTMVDFSSIPTKNFRNLDKSDILGQWSFESCFLIAAKLICSLDMLIPPEKMLRPMEARNKALTMKTELLESLWVRSYLLDDWNTMASERKSRKSRSLFSESNFYKIVSAFKQSGFDNLILCPSQLCKVGKLVQDDGKEHFWLSGFEDQLDNVIKTFTKDNLNTLVESIL